MSNNIDPYYQSGVASAEHRNIDAAGDGHPFGDEPRPFEADLRPLIREFADSLYESWEATVREYLANAETACLKVERYQAEPDNSPFEELIVEDGYEGRIEIVWDKSEQKLTIKDNGIGMAGVEVDEVFRHIGRSAARDHGEMSGAFGMGALSFVKFVGPDNSMVMTSHSRRNDDNAAYLVSLAGVEPIMGSLDEDEYGTSFQLNQRKPDMEVRAAIEKFAENQRVKVIYREMDENGSECFNEDYGNRRLYDDYEDGKFFAAIEESGFFEAYCHPDATGETLLLSMPIERNGITNRRASHPFDVRLHDESGKVVKSSNGNEGKMPCTEYKYEKMLKEARDDYVTEDMLSSDDVIAFETNGDVYDYAIEESVLESEQALPVAEYVPLSEGDDQLLGSKVVLIGPHSGREVVSKDEWESLPEGRASMYIPESELEAFDLKNGSGDLCLPTPTTDRNSLQSNDDFWEYLDWKFEQEFEDQLEEHLAAFEAADDVFEMVKSTDYQTVSRYDAQ